VGTYHIRTGKLQGRTFAIAAGDVVSVGRRNADLALPDMMVSRKHCLFDAVEGADEVTDMVSANGTWIDGQRVERAKLEKGNVIRIGETEIEYLGSHVQGPDPRTLGGVVPAAGVPGADFNTVDVNIEDVQREIEKAAGETQVRRADEGAAKPPDAPSDG
jgi:pSer/pThr/pTyr-binding forkhead associated (FHA) protein